MMTRKSKTLASYICVASILLSGPTALTSEIMESANRATEANKKNADEWAKNLVATDFERAFRVITEEAARTDQAAMTYKGLLESQQALAKQLQNFASLNLNKIEATEDEVRKSMEQYESLTRLRFDLSWIPTDIAERYRKITPLLQDVVQRFENTCSKGRSDFSYRHDIPREPNPPRYHFDLMIALAGPDVPVQYGGLNHQNEHKTRQEIITGSGITSSVASSILLAEGSAGAMLAASYALPVAGAVLVTALAVQHFANLNKANEVAAEIAAAELHKFTQSKRDDYVAEQYRKICRDYVSELRELGALIADLDENGPRAQDLISKELSRIDEIKVLSEKASAAQAAQCRLDLAHLARSEQCTDLGKEGKNSVCSIDQGGVVNLIRPDERCRIELRADNSYEHEGKDRRAARSFTKEDARKLAYHQVVMTLGKNKNEVLNRLQQIGWQHIDEAQEAAFLKMTQFMNLARKMNFSGIIDSQDSIAKEIRTASEFDRHRARFIDLAGLAVRVVFGQTSRTSFVSELQKFEKDFDAYLTKNALFRDAQALEASLRELKGILNVR